MNCPNCHQDIPMDVAFCPRCGHAISHQPVSTDNAVLRTFEAAQGGAIVHIISAVICAIIGIYLFVTYNNLPWWAGKSRSGFLVLALLFVIYAVFDVRAAGLCSKVKLTLRESTVSGKYLVMLPMTNIKEMEVRYQDIQEVRASTNSLNLRIDGKWKRFSISQSQKAKEIIDQKMR